MADTTRHPPNVSDNHNEENTVTSTLTHPTAMHLASSEPLAETVHLDMGAIAGFPDTFAAYEQRRQLETDLLIALAWAPADMAAAIVHALLGVFPRHVVND